MTWQLDGIGLVNGMCRGAPIHLSEPLSFWGGFDAADGRVIDRRHGAYRLCLTGRVVLMRAARGSSSGSSVLAEAIRAGTAPAGFILATRDAILTVGAQVALELYRRACPIAVVAEPQLEQLAGFQTLSITCTDGRAIVVAEHTLP